jgi:cell division cycle protein 37
MSKPFDYSKWDKIELSDDESDLHPNIDKDSWFRLKHRQRVEREAKEDEEVKKNDQLNAEANARLSIIKARLEGLKKNEDDEDAEFEDPSALEFEAKELEGQIEKRNKRNEDIAERRKWNIDNICTTSAEKSVVNAHAAKSLKAEDFEPTGKTEAIEAAAEAEKEKEKAKAAKAAVAAPSSGTTQTVFTTAESTADKAKAASTSSQGKTDAEVKKEKGASSTTAVVGPSEPMPTNNSGSKEREKFAVISYNDFAIAHEALLERYSEILDMEDTRTFLFKNCDVLLHEHAQSYMLLSCLEDEMNGKHERMKLVCRQSQILTHITELGTSLKRDPRDVILPFFHRISEAEYMKGFLKEVDSFKQRIVKRAKEKRKEMDKEDRASRVQEVPLGPGGLDPFEVLESLPQELQDAFESQVDTVHIM